LTPSLPFILTVSSALAMCGAAAGVWLSGFPKIARHIVPLGGLVLLLLSLFWIMPELGESFGWSVGPALMLTGFTGVWFIDRFVHPVCPACAHTHDHDACTTRLHGFAGPLITAAMIHSIFDGWMLAAGDTGRIPAVRDAMIAGILLHKLPESLAYGVILRAALRSRSYAMMWALLAQGATVVGALLAIAIAPVIGDAWIGILLAIGGGTFLYLGVHAVHGEWKRRVHERAVRETEATRTF
jgi:zinc transporter ZupT